MPAGPGLRREAPPLKLIRERHGRVPLTSESCAAGCAVVSWCAGQLGMVVVGTAPCRDGETGEQGRLGGRDSRFVHGGSRGPGVTP